MGSHEIRGLSLLGLLEDLRRRLSYVAGPGRSVRLGEKGIVIYAPVVGRRTSEEPAVPAEKVAAERIGSGLITIDHSAREVAPLTHRNDWVLGLDLNQQASGSNRMLSALTERWKLLILLSFLSER